MGQSGSRANSRNTDVVGIHPGLRCQPLAGYHVHSHSHLGVCTILANQIEFILVNPPTGILGGKISKTITLCRGTYTDIGRTCRETPQASMDKFKADTNQQIQCTN